MSPGAPSAGTVHSPAPRAARSPRPLHKGAQNWKEFGEGGSKYTHYPELQAPYGLCRSPTPQYTTSLTPKSSYRTKSVKAGTKELWVLIIWWGQRNKVLSEVCDRLSDEEVTGMREPGFQVGGVSHHQHLTVFLDFSFPLIAEKVRESCEGRFPPEERCQPALDC